MGKEARMSTKEAQRYALVVQIRDKKLTQQAAAKALGLSVRHQTPLQCGTAHKA
jgi:hypothetical protein